MVGQWWSHKKYIEHVKITKIDYKTNCVSFYWADVECVSGISGFIIRYYYNAKMTNDEIIKNIIK